MKFFLLFLLFHLSVLVSHSQTNNDTTKNVEIYVSRNNLRTLFGTYEFTPQFKMNVFSINEKTFAQRIGDEDKFQLFPKQDNVFFLKAMRAEIEFKKSAKGYDTLLLHQGGKEMKAHRISFQPYELYDTILHLDSIMYNAYNAKDLSALMSFFSPDLEFYHDLTGKTNYNENLEIFKANFSKPVIMRRELLKGSLEVYPVKDFGAIEIGTHNFFQADKGQTERLVAQPKFMHVWKRTGTGWKIIRIISYDH